MTRFSSSLRASLTPLALPALAWLCCGSPLTTANGGDPMTAGGKALFEREWTHEPPPQLVRNKNESRQQFERRLMAEPGDGLGPMFNATSCEACHAGGGASGVEHNVTLLTIDPRSKVLTPNSKPDLTARDALVDLYPPLVSGNGTVSLDVVVHEHSARPFFDSIRAELGRHVEGGAPDEWYRSESRKTKAIAERPVLAGRVGEIDYYLSQRNSPPLYGLGLIDKIDFARLAVLARSQQRRSKGKISGRVGAGKFGWRAQTLTLDQFVRGACAGEVGLQVARTPQPSDVADETYLSFGIDVAEPEVNMLVHYVRKLPAPVFEVKGKADANDIREGKRLFGSIGCAACHIEHIAPARGIYSDLLLHDMGGLLQAPSPAPAGTALSGMSRIRLPFFRPESLPPIFGASISGYYGSPGSLMPQPYPIPRPLTARFPRGRVPDSVINATTPSRVTWDQLQREWRTPPLWGVADSAPYLHDGRATTLDAAIRWHGGEAALSAQQYRSLSTERRELIIHFLAGLRAPVEAPRQTPELSTTPKFVQADAQQQKEDLEQALDVLQLGY